MTTAAFVQPTLGQRLAGPAQAVIDFLRVLSRRPVGLVGLIGIVFFLLLAFVAPLVVPLTNAPDVTALYQTPSLAHPLGTDFQGKDVLNQIVYGGQPILIVAILAAFFSTLIAISFGSIAATIGGRLDAAILAITDVTLTLPKLILLIAVAAIVRPTSFLFLAVILALLQWSSLLRQVRSPVLSFKERDYVEAARSLDLGIFPIVFRESLST